MKDTLGIYHIYTSNNEYTLLSTFHAKFESKTNLVKIHKLCQLFLTFFPENNLHC